MKLSCYVIISELTVGYQYKLLYSSFSNKFLVLNIDVVDLLKKGDFHRIDSITLGILKESFFIVNQKIDEISLVLENNKKQIKNVDYLYQSIQPSANCQLGCNYCGQVHHKGTINPLMEENIFQRIDHNLSKKNYKLLAICWFGGEPLMGLTSVKRLSKRLLSLARGRSINYTAKIVSNGLSLKKEIFYDLLINCKIQEFEITLDGTGEHHDVRRHTKEKQNTFDIIFKNIEEIVNDVRFTENKPKIIIRSNVDKNNCDSIYSLIDLFEEKKMLDKINFYIAPIHSWGNEAHFQSLTNQDFAKLEVEILNTLLEKNIKIPVLPGRQKNITCMSLNDNAELFDANGDIYNCSEVSQVPIYEKDDFKYRIGQYTTDFDYLDTIKRPFSDWNDDILNGELPCKNCEILPICGGACPKLWKEGIIACPPIKFNIEERMMLHFYHNKFLD